MWKAIVGRLQTEGFKVTFLTLLACSLTRSLKYRPDCPMYLVSEIITINFIVQGIRLIAIQTTIRSTPCKVGVLHRLVVDNLKCQGLQTVRPFERGGPCSDQMKVPNFLEPHRVDTHCLLSGEINEVMTT